MTEILRIEIADPLRMSPAEIARTYGLMIEAYAETESEIWGENYVRMPAEEYYVLIEKGEVLLARLQGEIVGTIWVHPLRKKEFGFGLLAADFAHKGLGIGRALIAAAEEFARTRGGRQMVIEILRPADFELPFKTVLADWYIRLGYQPAGTVSFLTLRSEKVEKAKLLKVPSVFDMYTKALH